MESKVYLYEYEITKGLDLSSLVKNFTVAEKNEELKNSIKSEMSMKALDLYLFFMKYCTDVNEQMSERLNDDFACEQVLYSKSGSLFGRYFCSDPIEELIVGNTSRGQLLKRRAGDNMYYFCDNRLIKAKMPGSESILYFYDDKINTVYEIACSDFYNDNFCRMFVKCEYDEQGRISRRTVISFNKAEKVYFSFVVRGSKPVVIRDENKGLDFIFEIKEIQYSYNDDRISSVEITELHSVTDGLKSELYKFNYDGDYYSDYDVFNYITSRKFASKVLKKRRFNEFLSAPKYSDYVK